MELEKLLKPVSDKHSVKEATISLFLEGKIIKPERFEALITKQFKEKFQKFEKISQFQIQIKGNESGALEGTNSQVEENVGFRFVKFEGGKAISVLQGMNELLRYFLSYHSLNYGRWKDYYSEFKDLMSEMSDFHSNLFVKAFSLHYIDEFQWNGTEVDPNLIFKKGSTLLPEEFFNCKLNNYLFTTVKKNEGEYIDRIEINIEQRPSTFITISHNVIQQFPESVELAELIKSKEIDKMLSDAHVHNKSTLVNLLNSEVCKLISLSI